MGTVSTEALPTMNSLTLTTLLCALTASAWVPTAVLAQEAAPTGGRPLDLTVPKEALTGAWEAPARQDATGLPDLGGQPSRPGGAAGPGQGGGPRSDLPYGSGYEARHGQGGGGGGRGMGRGRGR